MIFKFVYPSAEGRFFITISQLCTVTGVCFFNRLSCLHQRLTSKPGQIDENIMLRKCFTSSQALRLIVVTLFALIFVERPLQAYADPGSGLLLWQILGAVILGGVYQARRIVRKLRSFATPQATVAPQPSTNTKSPQSERGTGNGLFIS